MEGFKRDYKSEWEKEKETKTSRLLKIDKNLTNNKHIIQRCAILKLDCSCIYYNLRGKFRKYKKVIFRSRCMEE